MSTHNLHFNGDVTKFTIKSTHLNDTTGSIFPVTTLARPAFRPQVPTTPTPMPNSLRVASPQVISMNQQQAAQIQQLPRPQIMATTVRAFKAYIYIDFP